MRAQYRWVITKDHISEDGEETIVGVRGPLNADDNLKSNPQHFSVYDDDENCYAEGMLYATDAAKDYETACFGPLDDYARPALGCTDIKINGKWM